MHKSRAPGTHTRRSYHRDRGGNQVKVKRVDRVKQQVS